MIDCGCTTTSMRSYGVPKRWWASITSRPLFISVARVDRDLAAHRPRRVVERLLDRDVLELVELAAAERAAGGGDDQLLDDAGRLAGEQVVDRGVLGVDRDQPRAGGLGQRGHELAADDQRLLVGQRDVDALGQRDDRRAEAGGADDRVEHEVGAGLGDERDQALGAGEHLAARPRLGRARRGVLVGRARSGATPCSSPARSAARGSARRRGRRPRTRPASARSRRAPGCRSTRWSPG